MIEKNEVKINELECVAVHQSGIQPSAAVILCHGFGAPATDLVSLAHEFISADPQLSKAVYLFPAAPIELDPQFDSRAWWMIDIEKIQQLMASGQTREMRNESPDQLPVCRQMIVDVIEYAKTTYSLESSQVIVGGFSQGSMLATDVALHAAEPLGGLIIWSGALINEKVWQKQARSQSPLNIIQTHGRVDPILPIQGAEALRDLLVETGHSVEYAEFDGLHTIQTDGFRLAAQLIASLTG